MNMLDNDFKFQFYNELFLNLGAVNSPAEVHGMLCGELSCGKDREKDSWLSEIIDFMDLAHVTLSEDQHRAIGEFFDVTFTHLCRNDYTFSPLLPDDSASLKRRAEELSHWCQGFLHGVGASGLTSEATLSADVADAIKDLAKISQIDFDDLAADAEEGDVEDGERDLFELVEFVKVATLNIYSELGMRTSEPSDNQKLH